LRVGFGVASIGVADLMNRVRQPFNVNNLALVAAQAALDDSVFLADSYELNRRGMEQLVAGFKRLGLAYIPSHGNFITIEVNDGAAINIRLLKQGVIVRPIGGYGLPNHLRITIGLERENAMFLKALEQALQG
jgi:histidinol-phosphate aminotransferase